MSRGGRFVLPAILAMLVAARPARAQRDTVETHAWLVYAGLGVAVGGATGLASGYLLERGGSGFDRHPRLYGATLGGISGLALGLTLGVVDRVGEREEGFGALAAGTVLAAAGALLGGVENVSYDFVQKTVAGGGDMHRLDGDAFAVGAAWGTLVGVVGALVLTVVAVSMPAESHLRRPLAITLGTTVAPGGHVSWMPMLVGRY
jgi:hypothetical protein